MKLLDLFCGAGGAAMGYHRAGFDQIVGIDIVPQPNYPFEFIQADVATDDVVDPDMFDLIHASPPCQVHSALNTMLATDHQHSDLVKTTREMLIEYDRPYVIENVPGAPLINPTILCGSAFNLRFDNYELRRHRLFETSFPLMAPPCQHRYPVLGVYGDLSKHRRAKNPRAKETGIGGGGTKAGIHDAQRLMGIDWMTPKEIVQAIPPAYTEYIGRAFLEQQHADS